MKKEIDIGFVILHYKTDEQTIECIESIIKYLIETNYYICIVDNYSNNGSTEKIEKKYKNADNIKIIRCNKNLGFACGNNVGIKWINDNFNPNFIAVLNNDTKIINKNFYSIIRKEYLKSHFDVLGPKIRLINDDINPMCNQDISIERFKKEKKKLRRQIIIRYFNLNKITRKIKEKLKQDKKIIHNQMDTNKYYSNVILHGCFLIFSKKYFLNYEGFDDRTFLFHEEELLFLRLKKNKMKSIYNPNLEIFHEEDASTNYSIPNERKRALFKLKNMYKSNKIIIKELNKMR